MKALILAAAIATADMQDEPVRRTEDPDAGKRGRAERKRFTEAELAEILGAMEATPEAPPLTAMPERDFIPWEPERKPTFEIRSIDAGSGPMRRGDEPLAA